MTSPTKAEIAAIAGSLSEAQREALASPRWINPGGMEPLAIVDSVGSWPEGIALFFTLKSDRLTPLGLAVLAHLKESRDVR